ncbi:[4Fe-4S] proteins maturation [Saxophila tyrrhenica]|uniref:[4Fe-4S] proteins maturation n=1 Tax=Saxophila tyrrhenica TaxID=1690608 RepID=A0AAV9PCM5_9PEZI|nr:[4Fe-4S] proteins maturation [Saxophila tyrrhenica]
MATSTPWRSGLRRLGTTKNIANAPRSHHGRTVVQQRSLHTPAPLYLPFLAPSWQSSGRQASQLAQSKPAPQPQQPQRRHISTTPRRHATAITNPRKNDSGDPMTITITPRAASRLQSLASTDSNPDLALRVAVESGGCHGFQYLMSLISTKEIDPGEDTIFENEEIVSGKGDGVYKAKIVMDEPSLELLQGSSVDYTMELIGSQFKVVGIPGATSSCGCGTSFDVAA